MDNKIILIVGSCGTGKTWVMKQLMKELDINPIYTYSTGLYTYLKKDGIVLVGKYEGTIFDGSDRLSMSIMKDNAKIAPIFNQSVAVVLEGDRFTNSTFIETFNPLIVKILGDGQEGREKRGSTQTERHIKSISTRVNNINADLEFENSQECFNYIINRIKNAKKT